MANESRVFEYRKKRELKAPIMINLEITSGCNLKCRHCYNFWRQDNGPVEKLKHETMDRLIEKIVDEGVFHVVLTGGEPFANFHILEYALGKLSEAGISTSVNSNLMLTNPERTGRLREAGLDHILTSLYSHVREVNDFMMNRDGALAKIEEGIRTTVDGGIRVSANMVISDLNREHVYDTGRLCAELGAGKLFGTRLVPSVRVNEPTDSELQLQAESARQALDDLLRVKRDFGIQVGSLISYPLCFLSDLEKYADFVGRGCPAQSGNRMVLNADGAAHSCTHEETAYGNVFQEGIRPLFRKMRQWHNGSYLFSGCASCAYVDVCNSGCRMAAHAYFKEMNARDPLWTGHEHIGVPYKMAIPQEIIDEVDRGAYFYVPQRVRFREEKGFYTINVRWANAFSIEKDLAEFLMEHHHQGTAFSRAEMEPHVTNARTSLIYMIFKDTVVPRDPERRALLAERAPLGCSVNPFELPEHTRGPIAGQSAARSK